MGRAYSIRIGHSSKNTKVTERVSIQFRAEFFNMFNSVNFGSPDNILTDTAFGQNHQHRCIACG